MSVTDRHYVVTGASSGIGLAMSQQLLDAGYRVTGIARRASQCSLASYPGYRGIDADLAELESSMRTIAHDLRDMEGPHGLICCAGYGEFRHVEEFSVSQMRRLMDVNFLAHAALVKTLLGRMKRLTRAHIVFIGSEASLKGSRKGSMYCASKFALRGFSQALRQECANSGVRVTLINPGMTDTAFYAEQAFAPGADVENTIAIKDLCSTLDLILHSNTGTNWDEINLTPQKHVIAFDSKKGTQSEDSHQ